MNLWLELIDELSSVPGDAMANFGCSLRFVLLLLGVAATLVGVSAGKAINVTYDQRALIIDGQRRMLISAGIHYPRATPEVITDPLHLLSTLLLVFELLRGVCRLSVTVSYLLLSCEFL